MEQEEKKANYCPLQKYLDVTPGNEDGHYSGKVQPIHLILSQNLGFLEANVIKYVTRYRKKGGIQDLKKARWFLSILITREEENEGKKTADDTRDTESSKDNRGGSQVGCNSCHWADGAVSNQV